MAAERFYPMMAHLAKVTGRPVKMMFPKDQELAQLQIKPETITKFKVGLKKDGRIVALKHEVYVSVGDLDFGVHADGPGNAFNQLELYMAQVPNWHSIWCAYRTNAPRPGPSRSHIQQETKWSWENLIDELADEFRVDPIQYRTMHMTQLKPGQGKYLYETMPTVEVLSEGAKAFGWEKRNPVAGGNEGRFKRGLGLGMSQHHGGNMGYHEGEAAYAKLAGPAIMGGGGKFLARGEPVAVYEHGLKQRTVIIEFDSVEQAIATHDSPAYQEAVAALGDGAVREIRIIEGV